jgi:DNA replication protein DnaC
VTLLARRSARWGEIFGDEMVAAAMIDRLVHHAEILSLKGDSYRLRDKEIAARPRPALADEGAERIA